MYTAGTPSTAASDDIVADSPTTRRAWAIRWWSVSPRPRAHRGRRPDHQPGGGDQVVDLLHRPPDGQVGEVTGQRRLGRDEHPPAAPQHLDQVALPPGRGAQ